MTRWILAGPSIALPAILVFGSALLISNERRAALESVAATGTTAQTIERGRKLVNNLDCHQCHASRIANRNEDALEKKWILIDQNLNSPVFPWEIPFTGEISPGRPGIDRWTESQFLTSIQEGRFKGSEANLRQLFPRQKYQCVTEIDVRAISDYLRSQEPSSTDILLRIGPGDIL